MLHSPKFDGLDLLCADGLVRTVLGCSVRGIFEYQERLQELRSLLAKPFLAGNSVAELYQSHSRFRWLCDRCLALNSLQPNWVTPTQLEELLFVREEQGQIKAGWLVELNMPRRQGKPIQGKPETLPEVIAAIASHVGLDKALELVDRLPAWELVEILEAKNRQEKSPEQKHQEGFRNWAREMRQKAAAVMPGGGDGGA